ncbi:hypothetical protein Poly51_28230 [Rubripirellula tenax]|uniref:Calcium-dependent phosphoinositide phospholipase C n=1 Tax=Rubripirellula tenax TaxID=2528015 RepID=A0A5C6F6M5_9BACT|nr:phosphatidylinositol-specific phospholipase C1-like protein [Rubripirellula tenax]TWU56905.1 hypothetical protein Poly51_28230 [Rubripirellula tenax]
MRIRVLTIGLVLFGCLQGGSLAFSQDLRLNQIQTIGTHNSYHLAPPPEILRLIELFSSEGAEALNYSHLPIAEQLGTHKIRQIELDIYADPEGGLFANPAGHECLPKTEATEKSHPKATGALSRPGMKVIHSPGFDYRSTVSTFVDGLTKIRNWSQSNPDHIPILVLVELKDSVVGPDPVVPLAFDSDLLDAVDAEIRSVFADDEMILPDQIRGSDKTLRDALSQRGWPTVNASRGRVWFALDNEDATRERYLEKHPTLENRVMFVSVDANHPAAGFMKLNDPIGKFKKIQNAVKQGFIVRTRADAETHEARTNDTTRRDRAFESGAQYISTDYPIADKRLSQYQVQLPNQAEYRRNPQARNRKPRIDNANK